MVSLVVTHSEVRRLHVGPRSAAAREWRRYDRMLGAAGRRALDAARIGPGHRVLDVGCGAGGITLELAHRVGRTGAVVGIDTDIDALRVALTRAREQRLSWATFAELDVEHSELPVWAFDAVVSRFGIADASSAGLLRIARALVPGGRMACVAAGAPAEQGRLTIPRAVIRELFGPDLAALLPNRESHASVLASALGHAGLTEVALSPLTEPWWVGDDADDATELFFETEGRVLDAWLEPKDFERLASALRRRFSDHARPDGVWLPARAWLVSARSALAA